MRILMLGWEFPPVMAGGLGTACAGLTKSLVAQGHEITFILPHIIPDGHTTHVKLLGPRSLARRAQSLRDAQGAAPVPPIVSARLVAKDPRVAQRVRESIEAHEKIITEHQELPSSYPGVDANNTLRRIVELVRETRTERTVEAQGHDKVLETIGAPSAEMITTALDSALEAVGDLGTGNAGYSSDLFRDTHRYAQLAAALSVFEDFDVIHAHDWLAYHAGIAVREITGKPLVVHIHATEFDRSGANVNQGVYDIERMGLNAADRVVAVSRLTKAIVHTRYGVPDEKVDVVYNGVEQHDVQPDEGAAIEKDERIVLFLGRITMQKGPEYFIRAAKRVLEVEKKVKFVVAGSGDMAVKMIEEAAAAGIGHKVLFTGFLRGRDVDRVYAMADCYVMPSVSEPFGIAPLEAMRNDTPVIVSKQSGVAEVLTHALKVDFWDVDEMANKIVAVLRYPPLGNTLREHGRFELRGLSWDGAAEKCVKSYARAIASR